MSDYMVKSDQNVQECDTRLTGRQRKVKQDEIAGYIFIFHFLLGRPQSCN